MLRFAVYTASLFGCSHVRDIVIRYLQPLDFRTHAEETRLTINQWAAEQTHNKIKDRGPPETGDPLKTEQTHNKIKDRSPPEAGDP